VHLRASLILMGMLFPVLNEFLCSLHPAVASGGPRALSFHVHGKEFRRDFTSRHTTRCTGPQVGCDRGCFARSEQDRRVARTRAPQARLRGARLRPPAHGHRYFQYAKEDWNMTSPRDTLRAALDPKSVAIVGASQDPNKIGESRGPVSRRPVCGERDCVRRTMSSGICRARKRIGT